MLKLTFCFENPKILPFTQTPSFDYPGASPEFRFGKRHLAKNYSTNTFIKIYIKFAHKFS